MFKEVQDAQPGSMLEREFFYKKDREFIEKIKKNEALKADYLERTTHHNKCAHCGSGMKAISQEDAEFLYCGSCESLHFSLSELDSLSVRHRLRNVISSLLIANDEKNHKKKSA